MFGPVRYLFVLHHICLVFVLNFRSKLQSWVIGAPNITISSTLSTWYSQQEQYSIITFRCMSQWQAQDGSGPHVQWQAITSATAGLHHRWKAQKRRENGAPRPPVAVNDWGETGGWPPEIGIFLHDFHANMWVSYGFTMDSKASIQEICVDINMKSYKYHRTLGTMLGLWWVSVAWDV